VVSFYSGGVAPDLCSVGKYCESFDSATYSKATQGAALRIGTYGVMPSMRGLLSTIAKKQFCELEAGLRHGDWQFRGIEVQSCGGFFPGLKLAVLHRNC